MFAAYLVKPLREQTAQAGEMRREAMVLRLYPDLEMLRETRSSKLPEQPVAVETPQAVRLCPFWLWPVALFEPKVRAVSGHPVLLAKRKIRLALSVTAARLAA